MSKRAKTIITITIVLCVLVAVLVLFLAQHVTLLIDGDTPILDRATTQTNERQIGIFRAGMKVPVWKCLDLKAEFYFEVHLPNGRIGYVDEGKYRRKIESLMSEPFSQPVVFNCF
jgi:hypothetical protein